MASFIAFITASIALVTAINHVVENQNSIPEYVEKLESSTRSVIFFTIVAMILEVSLIILRFLNIGCYNNKIKAFLIIVSY